MVFKCRDSWRATWQENGKRRTKSFPSKNEATLFEAELKAGVTTVLTKEQESTTFAKWCERWHQDYARIEKSESTWEHDLTAIRLHLAPVIGGLKLSDIKKSHGNDLKTALVEKGLSPKTVNNVLLLAKKILSFAVDYELIPASPFQNVKPLKCPKPKFRFWTKEESDKFLKRCRELDPELANIVTVALHTGMRLGEMQGLQRKDIDFTTKTIRVAATWNKRLNKRLERAKNFEVGYVRMTSEVEVIMSMRKLMKPDQYVFRKGKMDNVRRDLQAMCDKANVQKITFHDLRHSFASQLAIAGVDIFKIQRMMRHKSVGMTERYAHLTQESLFEAVQVLCRPQSARSEPQITADASGK